jgi:hypothetical protein
MPPGDREWLTDAAGGQPLSRRIRTAWAQLTGAAPDGAGGSYVLPAVLLTGLALTGVAAYVIMRRRRRGGSM